MPLLYLAKVNLNSQIFEVYKKKILIEDISKEIYDKISNEISSSDKESKKYTDALGNSVQYSRDIQYSFYEIEKCHKTITGKLVKTFNKATEVFNEKTKKLDMVYAKESVSIHFYYDVFNELITFCERQSFGYNQFSKAFAKLLNQCMNPYEFQIFLQKDKDLLDAKLKNIKVVQRIRARLIPPNSNEDDIQELRSELNYMTQCEEINANKINVEYVSNNMNMDSKVMQEIINAVSRGYGDMTAIGINKNNHLVTVNSSQEAAFTSNIKDNITDKDFITESKSLINRFLKNTYYKITNRRNQ